MSHAVADSVAHVSDSFEGVRRGRRVLSDHLARGRGSGLVTDIEPFRRIAEAVAAVDLHRLPDGELANHLEALRREIPADRPLAPPLPHVQRLFVEVFAAVAEAARRTLGLDPHREQIVAGVAMATGAVAELATGEGKTLAAVFPAALHALRGRGVHVLTFNDYLARRDAAWMGPIYRLLGFTVGCVQEGMSAAARRAAYRCDITYATAKEVGFDLLRDGLCLERGEQAHRPFNMALVDEADSILIDEARIPLVIAGAEPGVQGTLERLSELASVLRPGLDFDTDAGARNIFLTDAGIARVEAELGCDTLFAGAGVDLQARVRNALHAEHLLQRDVDYIVRDGVVELVDELTGRVAENRHWPDGIHAAVEAKENLAQGRGGVILGSITLQHLLRLYPMRCGMTATAAAAAHELAEVYELDVVVVPPHRPCRRVDHEDLIFTDSAGRDAAVLAEIARVQPTGQPILVGTASVADSEALANALRVAGTSCHVLNALHDENEAAVIANAGRLGQVTISTNMAGRGTDIRLGGADGRERRQAVAAGGLYVIGTTRHESQRIDLQLRGRAGRQGDPGESRFFVSLEDGLLRRAGVDRMVPGTLAAASRDLPLEIPAVRRAVDHAQRVAAGECADIRRRISKYGEVVERQRQLVQDRRQQLLEGSEMPGLVARRCPERRSQLVAVIGEDAASAVERRLTVLAIDRCWADHLEDLRQLRDEIHLVVLGGRTPVVEFTRAAIAAFERLDERIDEAVVEGFDSLRLTADGVDWSRHDLRGPSATWTYLVSDSALSPNLLRGLANHASFGLWAALLWSPLLFAWGLYLHWKRRRERG